MKYHLFILGCQMNISDSQRLRTVFDLAGFSETNDEKKADLIVVVACSVRQSAIDRIHGRIKRWQKLKNKNNNLRTALTGCVLPSDKKRLGKQFDIIFDISEMEKLPQLLQTTNHKLQTDRPSKLKNYFKIIPAQTSKFSVYVPIMTGCDNFCSYCAVPYTRGREISRPREEIIAEVKNLVQRGYKDITLLGQNVNSYKPSFINLVKKLDKITGSYWVRFISNHPKDFSDDLIRFLKIAKHFAPFIHLPVQSGSDKILKAMKRPYKISQYLSLVKKIRKDIPNVVLTTDIIVGFPNETKKDFKASCDLFRKVGYDMAYLSQYSPRKGTSASRLADNASPAVKRERETLLNEILKKSALANNQKLLNNTIKILIERQDKNSGFSYGRTATLKPARIKNLSLSIGEFTDIKIISVTPWALEGKTNK